MEVPFDALGPGQSGRLVYQVMGDNGPIYNPKMIRFMNPDSSELPANSIVTGPSALQAGLAGAGLVTSVMNLAISAYIASGVAELRRTMDRIETKIDHIVEKVDRIDTQVAENNLRHAMNHIVRRAVAQDSIDLESTAGISEDLDRFIESLPGPLFLNFALRLSSDVRERLGQLYDLLHGVRKVVAQSYNLTIHGDPERVVTVDPDRDYFCPSLGGDLDTLVKATTVCLTEVDVSSKWYDTEYMNQFEAMGLSDLDDYLPEPHQVIFRDTYERESHGETQHRLGELVRAWLYRTDAGLFFRTNIEMIAINKGYEEVFWPQLQGAERSQLTQVSAACEVRVR